MWQKSLKIPNGLLEAEIEGQTIQWPQEKGQTIIYKALHRKLKIKQHEHHWIPRVNSGALEG